MVVKDIVLDRGMDSEITNNLLQALRPDDFALISPHLEIVHTDSNELLYQPGDNVALVHFPMGPSLVSYVVEYEDGREVESILVGREGAVGGIVSSGNLPAFCRISVKFGGPFARLNVRHL